MIVFIFITVCLCAVNLFWLNIQVKKEIRLNNEWGLGKIIGGIIFLILWSWACYVFWFEGFEVSFACLIIYFLTSYTLEKLFKLDKHKNIFKPWKK